MRRRIITVALENQSGALSRVAQLFSARGYNINSLTVAPTEDPELSRMTITTECSDSQCEQVLKQINKLIEVYKTRDVTVRNYVERELMMVKVKAEGEMRAEIYRLADIFRARIINVSDNSYIIEVTGVCAKLDAFLESLPTGAILETVRTGTTALTRDLSSA